MFSVVIGYPTLFPTLHCNTVTIHAAEVSCKTEIHFGDKDG